MKILVRVDYNMSLVQAIEKIWLRYDWPSPEVDNAKSVEEVIPQEGGIRDVEIEIFSFTSGKSAGGIFHNLDNINYRPASFRELIALTPRRDELRRELSWDYSVVALGTIWKRECLHGVVDVCGEISQTYNHCMSVPTYLRCTVVDSLPFYENVSFAAVKRNNAIPFFFS